MKKHSHDFVETFAGVVAFGLDRQSNEDAVQVYLQKFSDDRLMKALLNRMSDEELEEIFIMVNTMMRKYLKGEEYHSLFLKDDEQ